MISKNFIKSSIIYTIGGALPLATGILLLPAYTSFLTKATYGEFALYSGLVFLIQPFTTLGLETTFQSMYFDYADKKELLNKFIGTIFYTILIAGLVILTFLTIFSDLFQTFDLVFFPFGLLCIATGIFNGILKAYNNLLIYRQLSIRYFTINFVSFLAITLVTVALLYLMPNTLFGPVGSRFVSALIIGGLVFFFLFKEYKPRFDLEIFKKCILLTYPVFIILIINWFQNYLDRFVIDYYITKEAVGLYDIAQKCTMLNEFLIIGLINTIAPKIYKIWHESKVNQSTIEVNKYWNGITAVILLCLSFTIIVIPVIILLIDFKKGYANAIPYIPQLCLVFAFRGIQMMFIAPLYFQKRTLSVLKISAISIAVQVVISFVLIYNFELNGAVWSLFLGRIVELVLLSFRSKNYFSFKYNKRKVLGLPVIFSSIVITGSAIVYYLNLNYFLVFGGVALINILLVVLMYKKELLQLTIQYKSRK